MMTKKLLLIAIATILTSCSLLFITGCSGKNIDLDWQFEDSISIEQGDAYELIKEVYDTDGIKYSVSAEVQDADGKNIEVVGFEFYADLLSGYTICYTALDDEKNIVGSKTISVNVIDTKKPLISLSSTSMNGAVSIPFTLPEIIVTDNSGESISPSVKIYYVGDSESEEGGTEVSITDISMPESSDKGFYRLEISATDKSGNKTEEVYYFHIGEPNVIESFDLSTSSELVYMPNRFSSENKSWLAEYKGAKGVVKVHYDPGETYWQLSFLPRLTKEDYEKCLDIAFRIYVEAPTNYVMREVGFIADIGASAGEPRFYEGLKTNEWIELKCPINKFIEYFNDFGYNFSAGQLWGEVTNEKGENADGFNFYFDEIYAVREVEVDITNEDCAFDDVKTDGVVLSAIAFADNQLMDGLEYVFEVKNLQGDMIEVSNDNRFVPPALGIYEISVKVADKYFTSNVYNKKIKIGSDVAFQLSGGTETPVVQQQTFVKTGTLVDGATDVSSQFDVFVDVEWYNPINSAWEHVENFNAEKLSFVPLYAGEYRVLYEAKQKDELWAQESYSFNVIRLPAAATEVESFDDPLSITSLRTKAGRNIEWMKTFEGKKGVVKFAETDEWWELSFIPRLEKAAYEGYKTINIDIYIDTAMPCNPATIALINETGCEAWYPGTSALTINAWFTYSCDIHWLLDYFDGFENVDQPYGKSQLWGHIVGNTSSEGYYICIDSIYVS